MTPERLKKLYAMANQTVSPREAEIAKKKIFEGTVRAYKPRGHVHNWSEWQLKTANPSEFVSIVTPYSPGGFWIDRWWERQCVRGGVVKHVETKGMKPPSPFDPIYHPYENTETRVFIQASGSPFFNQLE